PHGPAGGVEPTAAEGGQPPPLRVREPLNRVEVDPEFYFRRDLIYVLAAGPRGARCVDVERVLGHSHRLGDDDRRGHEAIVSGEAMHPSDLTLAPRRGDNVVALALRLGMAVT